MNAMLCEEKKNGSLPLDVTLYIFFFFFLILKSPQRCVHLITHWEGGNLCIVIKYSSERMAEAGLCGWLPGDDGGKSLEVQEDRRRRRKKKWCLLCKSHKPVGRFNAKAAQSLFFFFVFFSPPGILHRY